MITGRIKERLDLTGTVSAAAGADLAFSGSGTVAQVLIEDGQEKVKAGDVIARTSRTALRRTLDPAQATLDAARAQLEADLRRRPRS